jgi:hypothetical protein
LESVAARAKTSPFLALGMLVEHHSNIRAVIAKARGRERSAEA